MKKAIFLAFTVFTVSTQAWIKEVQKPSTKTTPFKKMSDKEFRSPKTVLALLGSYETVGTAINVLRRHSSPAEGQEMIDAASAYGVDLRKKNDMIVTGPLSYKIDGIKNDFRVSADGKKLTHNGVTLAYKKGMGFRKHVDLFYGQLSKKKVAGGMFIPSAHAEEQTSGAAAYHAVKSLYYMHEIIGGDAIDKDAIESDPQVKEIISKSKKKIKSMMCSNLVDGSGNKQLIVDFEDGSSVTYIFNPDDPNQTRSSITDTSGNVVHEGAVKGQSRTNVNMGVFAFCTRTDFQGQENTVKAIQDYQDATGVSQ